MSREGKASPAAASAMVFAAACLSLAAVFASASALTCANDDPRSDGLPAACNDHISQLNGACNMRNLQARSQTRDAVIHQCQDACRLRHACIIDSMHASRQLHQGGLNGGKHRT